MNIAKRVGWPVAIAIVVAAAIACETDSQSSGAPVQDGVVPTPDMTHAAETMEAIAESPEQQTAVRNAGATVQSENATAAAGSGSESNRILELGPETASFVVEIAGQEVRLPDNVFIMDQLRYSWGESLQLPIWIFGKGESMIRVSKPTGEIDEVNIIESEPGHFDELREVLSDLEIQPTPTPPGPPTPTATTTATPTSTP